jgi:hypothetical protein
MILLIGAALVAASPAAHDAQAQGMDHAGMGNMAMPDNQPGLHEGGQSAFAAIAEATRAVEADPQTDWSKVSIDSLRQHLVDMDNVTLHSDVRTTPTADGARFDVTSADPRVRQSIVRMLHLHAGMANQEGAYTVAVQDGPTGVSEIVTGKTAADAARIRGLGFFGLLTEGVHHERHHLMLARGEQMHH